MIGAKILVNQGSCQCTEVVTSRGAPCCAHLILAERRPRHHAPEPPVIRIHTAEDITAKLMG